MDLSPTSINDCYLPYTLLLAKRFSPLGAKSLDFDDIVSDGLRGLIKARDDHDPKKGMSFKSYAEMKIKGKIIDEKRKRDPVPKTIRAKQRRCKQVERLLWAELGRLPEKHEVAQKAGWSLAEYDSIFMEINHYSHYNIDEYSENLFSKKDIIETEFEKRNTAQVLFRCIKKLDERKVKIIFLHYYEDIPFKFIAKRFKKIGVERVRQLHKEALAELKNYLERENALFSTS